MDAAQFGEYLHLIGFKPTRCDLTALKTLLTRHMAALPFQTLSTVLGEPVPIDSGSIFRKLVAQRRGGYCYELNLLLLDALTLLGFEARPLTGSVIPNNQLEEAGARTHMLLQVTLKGQPWLVDAGFGGLAPTAPLLLESEKTQLTPHGKYRLKPHRDGLVLCAVTGATQQLLYTFDRQPQRRNLAGQVLGVGQGARGLLAVLFGQDPIAVILAGLGDALQRHHGARGKGNAQAQGAQGPGAKLFHRHGRSLESSTHAPPG